MKRICLSMTKEFYEKVKKEANKKSMSISEYIRYAINRLWEDRR